MTKQSTHTPTPWIVQDNSDNGHMSRGVIGQVRIDSPSDGTVGICWHSMTDPKYFDETFIANAHHIVRCVNERDELLAALTCAANDLEGFYNAAKQGILNTVISIGEFQRLEKMKALIARADSK